MSIKDAIIATIAAEPDEVLQGRTLLQKKLYFLGVLKEEDFGFGPYYYGPYSSLVTDELGALVAAGFVEELPRSLSSVGPYGERLRYDYRLTPDSEAYRSVRAKEIERYVPVLERINASPVARDANALSLAAKVHLVLTTHGEGSIEDIVRRAGDFGWSLTPQQVSNVVAYLKQLDLVTETETVGS